MPLKCEAITENHEGQKVVIEIKKTQRENQDPGL